MPRGRPRGSANKKQGKGGPKAVTRSDGSSTTSEDNKISFSDLTDDQKYILIQKAAVQYSDALREKKDAGAAFLVTTRKIKADGMSIDDVKAYLDSQTEEGIERIRERIARDIRTAQWTGIDIGTQLDLFRAPGEGDDNPSFQEGRRWGLEGKSTKDMPARYDIAEFMRGWQEGQGVLMQGMGQKGAEDVGAVEEHADGAEQKQPDLLEQAGMRRGDLLEDADPF